MRAVTAKLAVQGVAMAIASAAAAQTPLATDALPPGTPLFASPGKSAAGATLRLLAPACTQVPYDRGRLAELLRVELRPLGVTEVVVEEPGTAPVPALDERSLAVVLVGPFACDETPEVVLTIADRTTRKTVTRRLNVTDVDAAGRPRVIAIAIAELLSASWVEFALSPTAPAPDGVPETAQRTLATKLVPAVSARSEMPAQPSVPPPRAQMVPLSRAMEGDGGRWAVEGAAITRLFPARSTALIGGAAGFSYAFVPHVRLRVSAELAFGEANVSAGSIVMGAATGSAGVGVSTPGPVELEVEPHVIVGAGWATGNPAKDARARARSYADVLGIAAVTGTVRARAGALAPFASVELGHTFSSLSFMVDQARGAGFDSVVFGARVGCAWHF